MAKAAKKSQVAEIVFQGINGLSDDLKKQGITVADIDQFVQEKAGGNPNNVGVRTVASVDPKAEIPFAFEAKQTLYHKDGVKKDDALRGKAVWQLINSGKTPTTLTDVDLVHKSIGARKYHALVDALNGGQSPSKKATWGNAVVELYVIPA